MHLTHLKPYRSLLLFELFPAGDGAPDVDELLAHARSIVPSLGRRKAVRVTAAASAGGLEVAFLHYVEERVPPWTLDVSLTDRLHHLALVAAKGGLVAVLATDPKLKARIARVAGKEGAFALLRRIPAGRINAAFVNGATRTLWLSGTHRRTAVKADAKILSGLDLRDSIDPLEDQSYYFSAARSIPDALRLPVGATPRRSAIWAGASRSWDDFAEVLEKLLDHLGGTAREEPTPFPVLASLVDKAEDVHGAFDVSLQPPELFASPTADQEDREVLERWAYGSDFQVDDPGPPIRTTLRLHGREVGSVVITPRWQDPAEVACDVVGEAAAPEMKELHEEAIAFCRDPRWLKIHFDSGHTLTDGGLYTVHHRDVRFDGFRFVDLAGWDVDTEKPDPISATGTGQTSLFDWVVAHWPIPDGSSTLPGGWLACDDGAMEIADFIHLSTDPPVLSLVHVKGSGSRKADRQISVSDYEVVTGQAIKNLRHLDRELLTSGLGDVVREKIGQLVWHDRAPVARAAMLARLAEIGTNYRKRVVVLQPRVTEARVNAARENAARNEPTSTDAKRLRQLDTLLVAAEATCHGLGAEFEVVTARA